MQLVPILTGELKPTVFNGAHNPLVWHLYGVPVRVIIRPGLPAEMTVCWVRTDIARALGYKSAKKAGESLRLIEGEDMGCEIIAPLSGNPGGPHRGSQIRYS